jgi:hypothetical protein
MTTQSFQSLPLISQKNILNSTGCFLMERKSQDVIQQLYQVKGFYVEVHKYPRTHKVIRTYSFEKGTCLDKWLSCIDLSELDAFLRCHS